MQGMCGFCMVLYVAFNEFGASDSMVFLLHRVLLALHAAAAAAAANRHWLKVA